jgi:hypothetical protein
MKKRFALILGATCSGTTGLFRQLGTHPQVLPCRVKEPRFFTDDRKWELGLDWYRSLWDFAEPDERIAIEASTEYSMHPSVPSPATRIAQMPTGFRFIYVMRDPLERIERQHARAWEEGAAERDLSDGVIARHVEASRYASQLDCYREHFPSEDFLLMRYEDFRSQPMDELRRVCRFLEIDPYFSFPEVRREVAEIPRRWWERIPGLGRRAGRTSTWRDPGAPRATGRLSSEQRARVLQDLRDDLERLSRDYGVDLSGWQIDD